MVSYQSVGVQALATHLEQSVQGMALVSEVFEDLVKGVSALSEEPQKERQLAVARLLALETEVQNQSVRLATVIPKVKSLLGVV